MSDPQTPLDLASTVAAFDLDGTSRAPWSVPIRERDWPRYLRMLIDYRLTGIATAALEAGWVSLTDAQAEELLAAQRRSMAWALKIERALVRMGEVFESAGLNVIVLKGTAVAHALYPDPSWRCFGDLDLLVRAGDWRRSLEVLASQGLRRKLPEPRPGFDERFGKAATHARSDGLEVDLHANLAAGPFGIWLPADELFHHTQRFRLADRDLNRLDDTSATMHALIHAALGSSPPLLVPLRDAAQVVASERADWDEIRARADRWGVLAPIQYALKAMYEVLRLEPSAAGRRFLAEPPPVSQRRALRAYTARRSSAAIQIAGLQAIPDLKGKMSYARMLLVPSREFMGANRKAHRGGRLQRWAAAFTSRSLRAGILPGKNGVEPKR